MHRKLRKEVREIEKLIEGSGRHAAAGPAQLADHAAVLVRAGDIYRSAGRLQEAAACLTEALDAYRRLDDLPGEMRTLSGMSFVLRAQDRFAEAADCCRRSLTIATDLGWEEMADALQWRIAAMEAADRAGIDVPDELVKTALHGKPGEDWVHEIDGRRVRGDHAPPEAVIRSWQVGPDRLLTGVVIPNAKYRAGRKH
ncbi:tetratricopeptide repeat protein [Streptomyces sp. SID12488]|uniref:tetratricopeptide repeat protein n=1 Tax=Streptomyces sp. SID12488 TaxID=2706040 RepID=UPI0013DB1CAB|nr:tetratricopeptide repeat protein [Streptomyces sp. SID12488]NEA68778.1 tetratricopeptide repeat protein [Streptomyces sp. SID12488]